jgi:hypothetical protein
MMKIIIVFIFIKLFSKNIYTIEVFVNATY